MPSSRAAAVIEPVRAIASSRSTLPGPTAMSSPRLTRSRNWTRDLATILRAEQAAPHGDRNRLVTIQSAKLAQDIAEVEIDGALGDPELVADVRAGHSARGQLEAFDLAP